MSKTKKLWGVSLLVLAFSFDTNAQTCKVPPTCESLGFTMTAATCNGKTILKCPFDEAKVYCPSALENNKIYKVGDTYTDERGIGIGKVVSITDGGRHGTVVASGGTGDATRAQDFCNNKTAGGLSWSLARSSNTCAVLQGCCGCFLRSSSGTGYCAGSWSDYNIYDCTASSILAFACEAPF